MVVGMAALAPGADAEALYAAANLEEDWQAEQWGWDDQAAQRRARKQAEFVTAARFAALAGGAAAI
jgi:chaperone required for assembly of F1-ATPase